MPLKFNADYTRVIGIMNNFEHPFIVRIFLVSFFIKLKSLGTDRGGKGESYPDCTVAVILSKVIEIREQARM